MTTIEADQDAVTLVNTFTVEPDDQQKLVDLLVAATEETMTAVPGFVSANIHRSLDGERIVNYAQWESVEQFEAMLEDVDAAAHMDEARNLATNDAHLYEVVSVHEERE